MNSTPEADWLNLLIGLLQGAQLQLLRVLDALGLAGQVHGQPAWPWSQRLSGENLLIDLGQARSLAWTLVFVAVALLALLLALLWRRPRFYFLAMVPMLLIAAPWPEAHVVLVPATPTSFQASPTGFTAASIAKGRVLYEQNCVACHGVDGRGEGPLAASLAVWPPNLSGPLLWRRADGDLLWRILHGTRDAQHGRATMPGFGGKIDEPDAWALIDYMKALGAGQSLRALGSWPQPIGLPDMAVRCGSQPPRTLASWRGQRVRIVAGNAAPAEDPRLVTVLLVPPSPTASSAAADCVAQSAAAWEALALIAGTDRLAGTQLIADRDGWLRVRGEPGNTGWSDDDLVCRSERTTAAGQGAALPADGLGALIARMDAEPVRFVKGGFIH
ncbi:c-type cytochrome [Variovorax paradoxus]|uniref:C-type cytochrome n=1 Tax=Variovorax paradoxus TaxID=34073 RepID=A0A6I6HLW5_VARPD|nr:cytochrome c [Variovorax paradoxus]QGW83634.1 c-type cytochrome [Variovorax paradoxus]